MKAIRERVDRAHAAAVKVDPHPTLGRVL